MRRPGALLWMLLAATTLTAAQTEEPRDSEITEKVEVELVLLDVTVVDRRREIVTGLTKDDFLLRIDDQKTPIATLDMQCPEEPLAEPPAVSPGQDPGWSAPDRPRRIVFAVDYRHLRQTKRPEVLEQLRDAVQRLHGDREELMIVALTDFLRIEQEWTRDGNEAVATLERMENDITLWEPPFDHLHDAPTFAALQELTDLLGTLEGEKIVVLFSDWPSPGGFDYDVQFAELTATAASARVSFYTVWTRGLTTSGTSRPLARLAVQTGGRFTERTNDFSLGYARAQRDSTCRYTVGFYDEGKKPERERKVVLRLDRKGVRVFHHDRYSLANEDTRERLARAALALPGPYVSESVEVALLPVKPLGRRRWQTVLAVQTLEAADEPVQVRTHVRRGNSRWGREAESREAPFSLSEPYRLRAGSYAATTTVSYPGEDRPRTATLSTELPALEGDGWLLVAPMILRALGSGPVAPEALAGTALEGDPLAGRVPVLRWAQTGDVLFATAQLCRYGVARTGDAVTVGMRVTGGSEAIEPTILELAYGAQNGLDCRAIDVRLPGLSAGRYDAELSVQVAGDEPITKNVLFQVD